MNKDITAEEKLLLIKRIERKAIIVLLALFFIVALPYLKDRYVAFDMIYTTTINDISSQFYIGWFGTVPLINIFSFLVLGYLLYIVVFQIRNQTSYLVIKRVYRHFDIVSFVVYLATIYIILNAFFFSFANVEGASMEPTFNEGDHVIMQHTDDEYEQFDLIVVKIDAVGQQYLIKRLIGLPGDIVELEDGDVYVNETLVDESLYLESDIQTFCEFGGQYCSFELGDDGYFVLGDNRSDSYDSRHFGPIFKENIYGTVRFRIRPISEFGSVK